MTRSIGCVSLVVHDYDEAIAFFTQKLGFMLREDTRMDGGKRWVVVAPAGEGTGLLLAKAATPEQRAIVGNQGGGRVFLFLRTEDFQRDFRAMTERGVRFLEAPRTEAYGTVAVFLDLCGNKWDLVEYRGVNGGQGEGRPLIVS